MSDFVVRRRKNMRGQKCVAPFIRGFNVWDIPESEWTPHIMKAVQHAWRLGYKAAREDIMNAVLAAKLSMLQLDDKWVDEE